MKVNFNLRWENTPNTIPRIIYFVTKIEGCKFRYPTGFKVRPDYWDKKRQCVKNVRDEANKDTINSTLSAWRETLTKFAADNTAQKQSLTPSVLKAFLDKWTKPKSEKDAPADQVAALGFLQFAKNFLETSKTRINPQSNRVIEPRTIAKYRTTINYLGDYEKRQRKELIFSGLDKVFYDSFYVFLQKKDMTPNAIGKHLAVVKTILIAANEEGYLTPQFYKSKSFKIPTNEAQSIYLNRYELNELANLELSGQPRLERVRDLFLIGCWTGLRFSDFSELKPQNIRLNADGEKNIYLNQKKTGGAVVIPMVQTVETILAKYDNILPPTISNQNFNDYLKEIGQIAGFEQKIVIEQTKGGKRKVKGGKISDEYLLKYELITTHTARRSFATNMYVLGVPSLAIMAITGHKTESAFMKYIKVTGEEQAQIMRRYWKGDAMINKDVSPQN
jgi:integrase